MSTREAPEKDVSLRYIHPPGERFFSAGVLAFCGFLATVQAILIPIFAEQGLGYQYVFACVVLVHVYIYQRAWQLTRKDRSVPADLFSLVEGYFFFTGLLYALPLTLAASWAILGADKVAPDVFVENNRALLAWAVNLDLPAKRPILDWTQHKNAVNIYYLTLAMLVGTLGIILSAPLLWLKAKGWSDYFDVNPKLFGRAKKIYLFFLGMTVSSFLLYCYVIWFSFGYDVQSDGSFGEFKGTNWQRQVGGWCVISSTFSLVFSMALGVLLNKFRSKGAKNV